MNWLLLGKIFTGLTRYSGPLFPLALNVTLFFFSSQYLIISYSLWCLTMTSVSVRQNQLIRQCTLRPVCWSPALLLSLYWRSLSSAPSPNLTESWKSQEAAGSLSLFLAEPGAQAMLVCSVFCVRQDRNLYLGKCTERPETLVIHLPSSLPPQDEVEGWGDLSRKWAVPVWV